MYEQLKQLETRLSRAAGDAWIEGNEYFDKRDTPEFNRARYDEMTARETIIYDALKDVKTALKVIEAVA